MNILYATIFQRTNQGEKAVDAPTTFISKRGQELIRQIKDHMTEAFEIQHTCATVSMDAFEKATDLQAMAAWFEHHYCYFDLQYGSMVVPD